MTDRYVNILGEKMLTPYLHDVLSTGPLPTSYFHLTNDTGNGNASTIIVKNTGDVSIFMMNQAVGSGNSEATMFHPLSPGETMRMEFSEIGNGPEFFLVGPKEQNAVGKFSILFIGETS